MKTIFVSGCAGGIGAEVVRTFLKNDCKVVGHCRRASPALSPLKSAQFQIIEKDLKTMSDADEVWQKATDLSNIDIVVNALGSVVGAKPVEDLTPEEIAQTFSSNLFLPVRFAQLAAKTWKSSSTPGRILNLSSIGVKFNGSKTSVHYSAAKMALEQFSRSFARDWAPLISCNVLRVGVTDTDFHKKMGRTDMSGRTNLVPVKRMATPGEVAEFIFIVATASDFLTGSVIDFAGGE